MSNVPKATEVDKQKTVLKSFSYYIMCPHCQKIHCTETERKLSCVNCCFFTFCSGCWLLYGILKDKDPNCYDASHRCSGCNNSLHDYTAC